MTLVKISCQVPDDTLGGQSIRRIQDLLGRSPKDQGNHQVISRHWRVAARCLAQGRLVVTNPPFATQNANPLNQNSSSKNGDKGFEPYSSNSDITSGEPFLIRSFTYSCLPLSLRRRSPKVSCRSIVALYSSSVGGRSLSSMSRTRIYGPQEKFTIMNSTHTTI